MSKLIRDWRAVNTSLIKRGEFLVNLDFLYSWNTDLEKMNREKRGGQYEYPNSLIWFAAGLRYAMQLRYRQLQGVLTALSKWIPIKSPEFSQLRRRIRKLSIPDALMGVENSNEPMVISVDASGLKVLNRGEWMREMWKVRRGWVKIHIAVDTRTHKVLAVEVTTERVGDSRKFKPLVKRTKKNANVVKAFADASYDTKENHNHLEDENIQSAIMLRKNASCRSRGSKSRAKTAREKRSLGDRMWKIANLMGQRWQVETTLSSFKGTFGEYVMAKDWYNIVHEVKLKCVFLNMLLSL